MAVIMITATARSRRRSRPFASGAFDFLTKPLIDEELLMAIERALNQQKVIEENKTLKAQLDSASAWKTSSATTIAC